MTSIAEMPYLQETLLNQRYGYALDLVFDEAWNTSLTTLLSHSSVRAYLSKPLPVGTLEVLIAAAQSAATSSNLQTWSVIAVEDPDRKDRLAQLANGQAHIRQVPLFLVWLADLARLNSIAEQRGLPHEGLDYFEMFLMSAIDASLAAQNAAIAAESLGLGTVYIGALRNSVQAVADELGLPPKVFPVFGLCIGYPDPSQPTAIKPRLPQSVVLHREQYSLAIQESAIKTYDEIMQKFYAEQNMTAQGDWSEHSSDRIATADALRNRAHLRDTLNALGFKLR
ncbi:NADPH-dependent oxidoreductase [Alkalinema sp. FACHB-956]|uniref:NADPH-dependent oxidoreductase n=1 Tax=Alkalinema sp. FACHB-956 TaxID=2692768 RepID=UPI0016875551|nr:NADPH-dependent oxidoreductase [Alkalinema sp. FACHB-956]MBD2329255.1 NADPH-dependent oxidoreductase [Alkalinema sp. FACHB-956]